MNKSARLSDATVLERNNVVVSGRGEQAMVFAHGFGCDQHMWRLLAPAFEDRYRVVLYDLTGAGQSDLAAYDTSRHATLAGHAADLRELLHALGLRQVVFVGHSVSAMIGILATIDEPDLFERLVLVAPSPRYINDEHYTGGFSRADIAELLDTMDHNYLGWSAGITPVVMGHPDRPELANELNASFCRTNPTIARHFARVLFLADNRADLPRSHTPALIVQCTQDALAPVVVGQYMQQHLAGSRLVVLKTSGHCPHLSAPQATLAAINHYLAHPDADE